ncbi:SPX domain-containing protein 4 [Cucumis melo var. makuwa]|uniref:SPX domain-containing protein 4 n=1 Tax=Cucumis melo var. makuwa TaxID=1194695 RepID=A0A5A7T893_CUCMM|nr:SPX domain-containing protein 4 [Cucumis melo var. makuwa]TYK00650.1 SPX domain-containing protein 4 [Cucumis melo var. makuwa]
MKFGKEFKTHLEQTLPEWRDKFLCYKPLKKLLKHYPNLPSTLYPIPTNHSLNFLLPPLQPPPVSFDDLTEAAPCETAAAASLADLQDWFVRILNEELEKLNDFYVDKEEEFVIRFQELKERIDRVKEKSSRGGVFTSENEFSEEMMNIRKDFVAIHGGMVLLKNYSSLNFAGTSSFTELFSYFAQGLIKILKKYDKRTGELLRLPYMQLVVRQPFFTTELLTSLVHQCEANLELLFPLEAEVIESTPALPVDPNPPLTDNSKITTSKTPSDLGEESEDLYRSIVAAMTAIRGLQKESSTNNPLSFSSLFKGQDDESTGAVTDENSPSNSLASLPKVDDDE